MKRWLRNVLLAVFILIFLVSAVFLGNYLLDSWLQKGQFDELAQLMEQAKPTESQIQEDPKTPGQIATEPVSELVEVTVPQTGQTVQVLPEYAQLYLMNTDLAGWITIDGTDINYPVMHTPDRTDYYLYRDFYKRDSKHGCLYIQEQCDVNAPADNVIIYGHRMKDGSMFGSLSDFEKQDFCEDHRYIQFNTMTERHTYEIIAVFKTVATEQGFAYHRFIDAESPEAFDRYVATCKELALYDTGVSAEYGDKLITLSTCEYSRENGRLVVVAKRIA